ncbi:MAG: response regulator [Gammaproteobacteria bacterium]|nr:response regulator [Gammaproteobacteria bacterium]
MSILIIDSKPGSEMQVRSAFGEQGFDRIDIIKTAEQALAFIAEKDNASGVDEVNLIVIDGELDDGDGFELCRRIRQTKSGDRAYIIMLVSSIENKSAIEKARHSGASDFAVKPYDGMEFIKHLMLFAHKKAVFLVEDDPVVRQLVMSLLYKKQVELIVADDGLRAYNLINSMVPPKLVLLDIGLPGMNGVKLVSHIRSKKIWQRTPVLMLTASTDAADVKGSLSAGANDYIVKPFKVADFVKRIDNYFTGDVS